MLPIHALDASKVSIGENAIVGVGAVVTKDGEANTVVAGALARVIRAIENPKQIIKARYLN